MKKGSSPDLRGQDGEWPDLEVHVLGLEHPRGAGLVEEGPEDGDEEVEHDELRHHAEAHAGEGLLPEVLLARGDVREDVPPLPEGEGGEGHATPGMPNASQGPNFTRRIGVRMDEAKAPALMAM